MSAVEHPSWCTTLTGCDARFGEHGPQGDHVELTETMRSRWGDPIEVGLIAPADDVGRPRIMLAVPFDSRDMVAPGLTEEETAALGRAELRDLGETVRLDPEEARMLARFLVQAADEWERAAGMAPQATR
jgi:hypothetical protein